MTYTIFKLINVIIWLALDKSKHWTVVTRVGFFSQKGGQTKRQNEVVCVLYLPTCKMYFRCQLLSFFIQTNNNYEYNMFHAKHNFQNILNSFFVRIEAELKKTSKIYRGIWFVDTLFIFKVVLQIIFESQRKCNS